MALRYAVSARGNRPITERDKMKTYALLGFILLALGIVAFAYQGITYATREEAVDPVVVHMTVESARTLPLSSVAGALALAGGIVVLFTGGRKEPRKKPKHSYGRWLL